MVEGSSQGCEGMGKYQEGVEFQNCLPRVVYWGKGKNGVAEYWPCKADMEAWSDEKAKDELDNI